MIQPNANPAVSLREPSTRASQDGILTTLWKLIVSLKLTVALFFLSTLLVFFGTLAQKDAGIWNVIREYFWSWYVMVPNHLISEFLKIFGLGFFSEKFFLGSSFPLVGGKTLGILLFINLTAGFLKVTNRDLKYPERRWRLPGIALLHLGLLLLMVGEFITREFAVEGQMTILNGRASNFIERRDNVELAILRPDEKDPKMDHVVVLPGSMLIKAGKDKTKIIDPRIPFEIEVLEYQANSTILEKLPADYQNMATKGDGLEVGSKSVKEVTGTDPNQKVDLPAAYVRLTDPKTEKVLGTWLVSTWLSSLSDQKTQVVDLGLKEANPNITLRFQRTYKPYTISLVKFIHDVYPGTDIPKNFQSDIVLDDPNQGVHRSVTIKMNEPLRHAGETFFQSSYLPGDAGTILQVVQNPGWVIPYLSCILVSLGMMVHFGASFVSFLANLKTRIAKEVAGKKGKTPIPDGQVSSWIWPTVVWAAVAMIGTLAYAAVATSSAPKPGGFDLEAFGQLPMLEGGRVKPIDTLARNRLMLFSQRQEISLESKGKDGKEKDGKEPKKMQATQWLLEVLTNKFSNRSQADSLNVFRIDFDQVRKALNLKDREGLRYSIDDLRNGGKFEDFFAEASRAANVDPLKRDPYQARVLELANNLRSYIELQSLSVPAMYPPEKWDGVSGWQPVGEILAEVGQAMSKGNKDSLEKTKQALAEILVAYAQGDSKKFNDMVIAYRTGIKDRIPEAAIKRSQMEFDFNSIQPFYIALWYYGITLVWTLFGWIFSVISLSSGKQNDSGTLIQQAAWATATLGFLIHSGGLIARMIITERPPITNLYTSAIYIGWGGCLLGLLIEYIFRRGFGNILSSVLGIATLIIAQNLSSGGDTMEVLQAVLDTNFWLATHVTTITFGYSATFVAGLVGMVYIMGRVGMLFFHEDRESEKTFKQICGNLIYGVVCFATFLSFVGTVLGGIWADQSWGRFWGWDPKENGAVLIVIWNSLILHARWAGLVKTTGMANLALFGNMVTAWSWFGTNQLGVGLHAYGFNNSLASGCMIFWISQCVVIMLGGIISLKDQSDSQPRMKSA